MPRKEVNRNIVSKYKWLLQTGRRAHYVDVFVRNYASGKGMRENECLVIDILAQPK